MSKPVYKNKDVISLVTLAQSNDIKALEELIKRVQKHIFAIFSHLVEKSEDVSDLTQEVLLKMAKSVSQLKNPRKFNSWLNQIITNQYYDFAKKNPEKFIELNEEYFNEIKDKFGCEPGEKCFFSELEKLIKKALMTLPKDLRITIVLREYEGLSYADISRITNTAIGTVKSRISRARMKLQNELKEFI
ncbi:sigma-70 family RNA polymerase sigma factor [bacterium]|nr:sigma-70 family RNA polymerase sigma factor [bacterium]